MSTTNTLLLGAIAGFTIFLGLPIGRLRAPRPAVQAFLNALAVGILTFLLYDVLANALGPVEKAIEDHRGASALGLGATVAAALSVGLLSLVYYDRMRSSRARRARRFGPGAATVDEFTVPAVVPGRWLSRGAGHRLALLIAVGIGLHNFSEGLAIGQSAARGEVSLAMMLIVGFGLHNATEGFGVVAPLAAAGERASWAFLGLMGLIAGGPTFLGTVVGRAVVNDTLAVAFLALAAGSILYVVLQLVAVAHRLGHRELLMWGVLVGLLAGIGTDLILVAAGA